MSDVCAVIDKHCAFARRDDCADTVPSTIYDHWRGAQ